MDMKNAELSMLLGKLKAMAQNVEDDCIFKNQAHTYLKSHNELIMYTEMYVTLDSIQTILTEAELYPGQPLP